MTDTMCYIYTSGTTGLPKASIIQHRKYVGTGMGFGGMLSTSDVFYGSGMPLYHSAAGAFPSSPREKFGVAAGAPPPLRPPPPQ